MPAVKLIAISIVIPSHNRREQLSRALRHIARLDYPADLLEVIVVLDGCTDGSARQLAELGPSFPFELRWLEQPQGGPSVARNAGVLAANHEYILFLDDDVMATVNLAKEHCRALQQNPQTVIVGTMSRPYDSRGPVWLRWEEYMLEKQYSEILNGEYKFTPRQFYTGNCSLKRDWVIQAGMFDESFKRYEDVELAYRLYKMSLQFIFEPGAIAYHYPMRTYKSWIKMHYLYGRYAVRIDREKKMLNMIEISKKEFQQRNILTQLFAQKLLHHRSSQMVLSCFFVKLSQFLAGLSKDKIAYRLLSLMANILFWQGFNDELSVKLLP